MKRIERRDKPKIYGDLLSAFNAESKNEKIVLTQVQIRIGVPYDRFKKYVSELKMLDLIEDEACPRLTLKGKRYLNEYKAILAFMKEMGITYR